MEETRIDRWLWAARFFKTRGTATAAAAGHVLLNGEPVKPSKTVRRGDRVQLRVGPASRTVVVAGIAAKRGSAAAAAVLYEETAESVAQREERALQRRLCADPGGRPTKRDRRRLEALRHAPRHRADGGRG